MKRYFEKLGQNRNFTTELVNRRAPSIPLKAKTGKGKTLVEESATRGHGD